MNKLNKRAFTLVELLVVIAILAVLATAAIIGYSSFIEKANVSNDNTVVTELNRFTDAYIAGEGKVNTVTDIAEELKSDGFLVSTLKPAASKDLYAFNINTKKFLVVDVEDPALESLTQQQRADIFVLVGNEKAYNFASSKGYSMYLQTSYADQLQSPLTIVAGLDVGEYQGITEINYDHSSETSGYVVVIRTNSYNTVLTIDAENDTVTHYGKANKVDITSVYTDSYHEFGNVVGNINLTSGSVVIESSSSAAAVVIQGTDYSKIKANNEANKEVPIIMPMSEDAWAADANKSNINPEVNNIIYTIDSQNHEYGGVIKKADGSYDVYFDDFIDSCTTVQTSTTGNFLRIRDTQPKAGDTIILFKDVDLTAYEYLQIYLGDYSDELSINLNGHKLTLGGTSTPGKTKGIEVWQSKINIYNGEISSNSNIIYASANGSYHINNVEMDSDGISTSPNDGVIHCSRVDCIIENSVIKATGTTNIVYSSKNLCIKDSTIDASGSSANVVTSASGSGVTLDNVDIKGNETAGKYMFYFGASSSTLTINSGNFTNYTYGKKSEGINATIIITGGTFDADPSAYVSEGYHVTNNGNGTWTVSAD